jgi:Leucine-rich repeat (LRR) protein
MEPEFPSDYPHPTGRRCRWGLSVRGLMVLVLVIGSWLGWYGLKVREQRDIVAAIRKAGGDIGYDWQIASSSNLTDLNKSTVGAPEAFGGRVVWPRWLVDLLGIDAFGRVDKVWIAKGSSEISEPLLAQIGKLRHLEVLSIHNRIILDTAGLVHLKDLSGLRDLHLGVQARGQSTDLSWLRGKTQLEMLHLGTIAVRDNDLIHLRPLTNLRTLVLRSPHITDAGLVHLSGLTRLQCLIFAHDSIRGEGLAHLDRMRSLETLAMLRSKIETLKYLPALPIKDLCLPFSLIDDRGLARIRSMPALDQVFLDGTKLTDAGLESLIAQPKLKWVYVNGTGVTPSGAAAFRAKKPRGVIGYGPIQKSQYFLIP